MAKNIKVLLDKSTLYEAIDVLMFLKEEFQNRLKQDPPEDLKVQYQIRHRMIESAVHKLNQADLA
jgi:hypothetical protein